MVGISLILDMIMNFIELFVESYVELVHHLAWPVVVLVALYLFRKELGLLMGRIEEYQHGDKRVVFSTAHKQGGAKELPISEPAPETEKPAEPSKEAKKILATLWKGQKRHFEDDFTQRWSFRVLPNSEAYGSFMVGFAELLRSGLIGWTRKDGHAILIDKGIEYIKKNTELQQSNDIY
jgi:hypothetical protein